MAKFPLGITGPFVGKIGTVVGSSWKGTPYGKSLPIRRVPARDGEKANRQKFAAAQLWLQPLLNFVREGFRNYSDKVEGFMAAKSYLLRNGFENSVINPALVKVSYGILPLSENIKAEKTGPFQITFSWDTEPVTGAELRDQVMLLAYDIDHQYAKFSLVGQFRETGSDTLNLVKSEGCTYHLYLAFIAQDRSSQSDSVYLGTITT